MFQIVNFSAIKSRKKYELILWPDFKHWWKNCRNTMALVMIISLRKGVNLIHYTKILA
jgi:hypothetical protein